MNIVKLTIYTLAILMIWEAKSEEVYLDQLSKGERKILSEKRRKKSFPVAKGSIVGKKTLVNPNLKITRNDPRIRTVRMTSYDSLTTKLCYANPVRIFLQDDFQKIAAAGVSENAVFFSAITSEDKRSVVVSLKKQLGKNEIFPGYVSIQRKDGLSYNIHLIATACPLQEDLGNYPQEIRLIPIQKVDKLSKSLLNKEQFLAEITEAYPRVNIHEIQIGLMRAHSSYTKIHLPISLIPRSQKDEKREDFNIEFIFVDSLEVQKFGSKTDFLKYSSIKRSRKNGAFTMDFNAMIDLSTDYINSRKYIYLIIIDRDRQVYQQARINLKDQLEKLKDIGFEIN